MALSNEHSWWWCWTRDSPGIRVFGGLGVLRNKTSVEDVPFASKFEGPASTISPTPSIHGARDPCDLGIKTRCGGIRPLVPRAQGVDGPCFNGLDDVCG